jgi:hypothetical protein
MKTQTTKKVEKKGEEKKEFDLKEAFVLWKHESKANTSYLTGYAIDPAGVSDSKIIGFFNTNKKNAKEPDVRVYLVDDDGKRAEQICSLWENVSKNDKRYLTGSTDENEKITAFYNNSDDEKKPYIRAYYKEN